jgi:hypothetical protein
LGGLVLVYPTELTAASIYSRQERRPVNWTTTHGGRRSRKSLAQGIRGIYRGDLTGDDRTTKVSHGDAVNVPRYVAQGREAAASGELIRSDRGKLGTVARVNYWLEHIRGAIFTDPPPRARITAATARIRARLVGGEGAEPDPIRFTVLSDCSSVSLTDQLRVQFSPNFPW